MQSIECSGECSSGGFSPGGFSPGGAISAAVVILLAISSAACGDGQAPGPDGPDGPINGWEVLAPIEGGPIQEIAVVELDGKIYVIGGFEGFDIVAKVQVYDPATDTWSEAAPLPRAVHHANAAAVDGKLYVLGALETTQFTAIGDAWEYDPAADAWRERAPMTAGTERGAGTVGVIDGRVFIAGGLRGGVSVADLTAYDPASNTWDDALPPVPEARDHLMGAAVGGKLYAIGGRNGGIGALRDRVDVYDPALDAWSPGEPMPTARGGGAAGVVDGRVVVVGGEGNAAASTGVFPQVESYDPAADEWTALPPMRTPRHGMGAAGLDGKLYVPGGADVQAFGAVATNEALTP